MACILPLLDVGLRRGGKHKERYKITRELKR